RCRSAPAISQLFGERTAPRITKSPIPPIPPCAGGTMKIGAGARTIPVRFRDTQIEMPHGAGGKASRRLIEGLIVPALCGAPGPLGDAAHVTVNGARIAITADSFVVKPLRFPGGSIGELAVNGTVNDLAVSGARPLAITLGLVLEEGLESATLREEVQAIAEAARAAGVEVVAGDTKVVEHGKADR